MNCEMGEVSFEGLVSAYQHGSPETRQPSRNATIFRVNAARPVGLEPVAVNYTAPAAWQYVLQRKER